MTDTVLGRITAAKIGFGGYQEAMFGLSVSLEGKSWGVGDFKGFWCMEPSSTAKWNSEDQIRRYGETMDFVKKLLVSARKSSVDQLVGVPVECTFKGTSLESWRVLEEVL